MIKHRTRYLLVAALALIWTGCDSNDSDDPVVATRAVVTLTSGAETVSSTLTSRIGFVAGAAIQADTLHLTPGVTYTGTLELFGENNEDVTELIRTTPDNYNIAYEALNTKGVEVEVTDRESDYAGNLQGANLSVGLSFEVELSDLASIAGSGILRVFITEFGDTRKTISSIQNTDPTYRFDVPVFIPLLD